MFKRTLFILLLWFATVLCKAQAVIKFDKTVQHLGFVHKGDTLHFEYVFTNTGNQPLVISDTKVECGCTTVEKPAAPVMPGKQGVLNVIFNTSGAIDRQDRTIVVASNASNSVITLRFKCIVLKRANKS